MSAETWFMAIFEKRLRDKICALHWYEGSAEGSGSGSLLVRHSRRFVLTCAHVATPFYAGRGARIHVPDHVPLDRSATRLLFADSTRDLALLEVVESAPSIGGFELEHLEPIQDFTKRDFSEDHLLVCGFPYAQIDRAPGVKTFHPLLYLTGVGPDKPEPDLIHCNYPTGPGNVIGLQANAALPNAPGLSGCPILTVPSPSIDELPREKVWTIENMRVVGVAITWNRRTFLEGTRCGDVPAMIRGEVPFP